MCHRAKAVVLSLLVAATAAAQTNRTPVLTALSPTSIVAGSPAFTLNVTGANFVSGAQVRVNGVGRVTTFVDAQHLTAAIPASDVLNVRTLFITATNPGTVASAALSFQVVSNTPSITSINPTIVATGSDAFTLTVTGRGFASTARVRINNEAVQSTTFVSETQLTAVIPEDELNTARNLNITVLNPAPINRSSNTVQLAVSNNVSPTITLLDPDTVAAGSPGFTLSIIGTNFSNNAFVKINNLPAETTVVSSTRVTTPISASQISIPKTLSIVVTNATTGLSSPSRTFTVTAGLIPEIDSINPSAVPVGSDTFTLAVTGSNFTSASIVRFNGFDRSTTFIDSRHLNATISGADINGEATHQITVFNPPPNGGTSSSKPLIVFSEFAPVLTSLSPASFLTNSESLTLTVIGSGFALLDNDVVLIDGFPRVTEFVNSTTLVATLVPEDVAEPGTRSVTVTNDDGFTSAPLTFTVSSAQAGPAILSISPAQAGVGDAPFTLTITGSNFVPQSLVTIDGTPRATTFVSPAELKVDITSSDLASPREMAIAVRNPEGAPSTPVGLKVNLVPPTITSLTPSEAIAGDTGFTLFITGTRFSTTSIVKLNGTTRIPTFDAPTGQLLLPINAADLTVPGTIAVTVTGAGGTSAPANLTVLRPRITSVSPSAITAGSDNVTLVVQGVGFLPTSQIVFLGVPRTTTRAEDGSLSTILTAADLNITGIVGIRVQNTPDALSDPFVITVSSPGDPRIDSLSPSAILVGTTFAEVTVRGANFFSGAVVRVNGVTKPTEFVSATELVVTLTAGDLATTGTLEITVMNPNGSTSIARQLSVVAEPPPPSSRRRAVRR
jgi:hypothetical protein